MFGGAVKKWKIVKRIHQWKGEGTEKQGEIRKDRWMEKLLKYLDEKEEAEERDNTKETGKPGYNSEKLLSCAFP